ncbi:hypothetical protein [Accumulibacter sp.]|uniref:hypothetical protein n=1 Tax=Accumulibacter sp. TaxID=2053492 RepID=UPI00260D3FDE|nr:hypothetical protein [Accumulibacter sp.]
MAATPDLQSVFAALRPLLTPHVASFTVVRDAPGTFSLCTKHLMPNKKPLFFGAVQINKTYVSFHLMPVYVFPELLASVSLALRKRMQGKSCFNFKRVDSVLFQELDALVTAGHARYVQAGYVAA